MRTLSLSLLSSWKAPSLTSLLPPLAASPAPKKQRKSKLESPVVSNKIKGKGTPKQPALFKLPRELLDSVRPPLSSSPLSVRRTS